MLFVAFLRYNFCEKSPKLSKDAPSATFWDVSCPKTLQLISPPEAKIVLVTPRRKYRKVKGGSESITPIPGIKALQMLLESLKWVSESIRIYKCQSDFTSSPIPNDYIKAPLMS